MHHPELTMAAYKAAIDDGADGFECDVRITKDKQLVLWHDADMQRVAGSSARIADSTLSEIKHNYPEVITLEEFVNNPPISTAVTSNKHKMSAGLVYILTETNRVYILNQQGIVYNENTPYIHLLHTNLIPKHIIFDNSEEFFYIIYDSLVAKYSMLGLYINTVEGIPTDSKFICASQDIYHNIYVADSKRIFKFVDVVQDFSIVNENYDSLYWSEDEIIIKEEEFVQDWVYNRCLKRVAHNVDNYRKSIHSRFGINTVYYPTEVITYYTAIPIPEAETSLCSNLIHEVGVGANEFTITQVLNRDIEKIYNTSHTCCPSVKTIHQL